MGMPWYKVWENFWVNPKIQYIESKAFNLAAPDVAGAGVEEVWKFKCLSSGISVVTFTYGATTHTYNITINQKIGSVYQRLNGDTLCASWYFL